MNHMICRLLCGVGIALSAVTAPAQSSRFYTFGDGLQPNWTTNDVGLQNCSGAPDHQVFQLSGGLLQQRLSATPACNAFFYGGSLPGVPAAIAGGLDRWSRTAVEANLAITGGSGLGAGAGGIPILWLHTIGRSSLRVDLTAGAVGLEHAGGIVWIVPPAGLAAMQNYRLLLEPNLGTPLVSLWVDGVLRAGPLPTALDWIHDGWAFGDGSTGSAAIDIDWDYFSIAQGAPGFGQANTAAAMLFVFEPYWFPGVFPMRGAPGQAGPFRIAGLNNGLGLQWSGPGGAPFALLLAPTAGLPRPFGCGGNVDIGTAAGFADLAIAFDPTVPVFGSLFMLTGSGHSGQTLQLPSFPPGFLLGAIQGVVFQPPGTSGCGYRLTAAFELRT